MIFLFFDPITICVEIARSVSTTNSKDAAVGNIDVERNREQQKQRQEQSQHFKVEKLDTLGT